MSEAITARIDPAAAVAELHDGIAHLVADALETGSPTWDVAACLLHEHLGREWAGVSPVVLARALGRRQAHDAAAAEQALAGGDTPQAMALVAELERTRRRLATVLDHR